MKTELKKTMRDVLIEQIYNRMRKDKSLFFITADFGSPKLDRLKEDFRERFINVGIAEQNLINVATGLALEGFTVYAYAIAPFLTMRAYEQIRNNLSLLSQLRGLNINLLGVGAGLSYDVSGPSHHCLEDLSIMRTLPNIDVFSPSDWVLAGRFMDYSVKIKKPKYGRLDSKPLPRIYEDSWDINFQNGFYELARGEKVCIVSTGFMTQIALKAANRLREENIDIGLIDIFLLRPLNETLLFESLRGYKSVITIEEAFINKGGMDSMVSALLEAKDSKIKLNRMGFKDEHVFDIGSREHLHKSNAIDEESVINNIKKMLN